MKIKLLMFTIVFSITQLAFSAKFTFTLGSGSYSPTSVFVKIGDTVLIPANGSHPTMQVSSADWHASNNSKLAGGFGPLNSDTNIIVSSLDTIFFMCNFHGPAGMKAFITIMNVSASSNFALENLPYFANPTSNNLVLYNHSMVQCALGIYDFLGRYFGEYYVSNGIQSIALKPGSYLLVFRNKEAVLAKKTLLVLGD